MKAILRPALWLALTASLAFAVSTGTAAAAEERPGWELFANSDPTNFSQGVDEIQEVTVSSGEPTFTLTYEGVETAALASTATSAEVQSALEALSSVGSGNVIVSTAGAGNYQVRFVGALGNLRTARLQATGASTAVVAAGAASGTIQIDVFNVGAVGSSGTVTVTDKLPSGIKAKAAGALRSPGSEAKFGIAPTLTQGEWNCSGNGASPAPSVAGATEVTCTNDPMGLQSIAGGGGTLTFSESVQRQPPIGIAVEVGEGTSEGVTATNDVSIVGGGALGPASTTDPVTISKDPPKEGLTRADAWFSNANGTTDVQAGSHPYAATFVFAAATALPHPAAHAYLPGSEIRDLETRMPPGLIGDLHKIPQCSRQQLSSASPLCPPDSMVGRLMVKSLAFNGNATEQVFNMVPEKGSPAELGFFYEGLVFISFSVNTGGDDAITAHVNNIPTKEAYESVLVLWGAPAESSHNPWRYLEGGCGGGTGLFEMEGPPFNGDEINYCRVQSGQPVTPILRMPTSCSGPQTIALREASGWQKPSAQSEAAFPMHDSSGNPAGMGGCELLSLEEVGFSVAPESRQADSPSGLAANIRPSLNGLENVAGLSPPDFKAVTVTLPEGLVINPGQAAGLQACPAGRPTADAFGDALTTAGEASKGIEDIEPASCPAASKVGTVIIKSPPIEADTEKQFNGNVYVLPSNPPEVKLLVAASADGVNLKLVGTAHLNEQTGRVETKFESTPQFPFSDFEVSFEGGTRAALATPTRCDTSVTEGDFSPWSAPLSSDALSTAAFAITEGPGGSSCPSSPLPLAPSLAAGSASDQAGGFTTLTTKVQRGDGQQRIERLRFVLPPGLAGMISSVTPCQEPFAANGGCTESAQIGHATVTAGPGANPLVIPQPGAPESKIYLTGPYEGAPFGVSIVTPVIAGPFNLGTIVTRGKIEIDPRSAQVTISTDPLPQIVKGVPTDLRSIEAVIDRKGFTFNPTNCNESAILGTAVGTGPPGVNESSAQVAQLSSRFQVGSCRSLTFTPQVSLATGAHASKANGQSLSFKISYPRGAMGSQAWFKEAKFDIPKQLPAEDRTLQQACLVATFETNRAACPTHSKIGTVIVHTPVLPVPLEGSVYFVSYGGAKFPDVVMVLSGDNVNIMLTGETLIKNGVTSATFHSIPDVPFESVEVTLPTGPYSEFGGYINAKKPYDFCGQKLIVPTFLKAQNGLEIRKSVPVAVNGCSSKPSVVSAKVKAHIVTMTVYVPGAGRIEETGNGLGKKATKTAHGQELLTFVFHTKHAGRFRTKIHLRYRPTGGRTQSATASVVV